MGGVRKLIGGYSSLTTPFYSFPFLKKITKNTPYSFTPSKIHPPIKNPKKPTHKHPKTPTHKHPQNTHSQTPQNTHLQTPPKHPPPNTPKHPPPNTPPKHPPPASDSLSASPPPCTLLPLSNKRLFTTEAFRAARWWWWMRVGGGGEIGSWGSEEGIGGWGGEKRISGWRLGGMGLGVGRVGRRRFIRSNVKNKL